MYTNFKIFWSVDKYMPFKVLNTDSFALPCAGRSLLSCGVIIVSLIPSSEKSACLANKYALLCRYKIKESWVFLGCLLPLKDEKAKGEVFCRLTPRQDHEFPWL